MNVDDDIYKPSGRIVLKIEKFSELAHSANSRRLISDAVHIQGLSWKILAIFGESKHQLQQSEIAAPKCLDYYVQCNADNADAKWSCAASISFRVIAQKEGKEDHVEEKITHIFNIKESECEFAEFMTLGVRILELMDRKNGWYDAEKDTVILAADVTADAPYRVKTRPTLADRMLHMLNSGKQHNVHFLVGAEGSEKEQFTAHKGILSTFSDVFDRMFDFDSICGNSDKVIEIPDVKPEAFRVMLNFIYTMSLRKLNQDNVFDVLHAATKYNITDLIDACVDCPNLDVKNVLYVLGKALPYDVKGLINHCWKFIDKNACAVLEHNNFLEIDQALLCQLFSRDQLAVYHWEIVIWNAALRWADAQCHKQEMEATGENRRKVLGPALFKIRFPLIPKDQFASVIAPTQVLTEKEMLSVFLYHEYPDDIVPDQYPLAFSDEHRSH